MKDFKYYLKLVNEASLYNSRDDDHKLLTIEVEVRDASKAGDIFRDGYLKYGEFANGHTNVFMFGDKNWAEAFRDDLVRHNISILRVQGIDEEYVIEPNKFGFDVEYAKATIDRAFDNAKTNVDIHNLSKVNLQQAYADIIVQYDLTKIDEDLDRKEIKDTLINMLSDMLDQAQNLTDDIGYTYRKNESLKNKLGKRFKKNEGFGSRIAIGDLDMDGGPEVRSAIAKALSTGLSIAPGGKLVDVNKVLERELGGVYYDIDTMVVESDGDSILAIANAINKTPEEVATIISNVFKKLPGRLLGKNERKTR